MPDSFSSFAALKEQGYQLTRKFGGTKSGIADPYISGYFFSWFQHLPTKLADYVPGMSNGDIARILAAACLSVTPPGGTLNKAEFTGLGGVKWSVPTNIDYGNTITLKFLEYSGTPINKIFRGWFNMIRDYRTGLSRIEDRYTKSAYAATLLYWITAPNASVDQIEFAAVYDGVFPSKDPSDLFTGDVEAVDKLEIEIEFNVDTQWLSLDNDWVIDRCKQIHNDILGGKQVAWDLGQKQV